MSQSTIHILGSSVYSIGGHKGIYVAPSKHGHIVRPLYDAYSHDGESEYEQEGDLTEWTEVYVKPPVAKLYLEVAELDAKIEAKQKQLNDQDTKLRELKREEEERLKRIQNHFAIKHLDDYLTGKVTHYVTKDKYGDGFKIRSLEETRSDEHYHKDYAILCLQPIQPWGSKDGDQLQWKIKCSEKDGYSYYWKEYDVMPCRSYEEAIAHGTTLFNEKVAEWRKGDNKHYVGTIFAMAKTLGVPVPDDVAHYEGTQKRKKAQCELDDARKKLAAAEAAAKEVMSSPLPDPIVINPVVVTPVVPPASSDLDTPF